MKDPELVSSMLATLEGRFSALESIVKNSPKVDKVFVLELIRDSQAIVKTLRELTK